MGIADFAANCANGANGRIHSCSSRQIFLYRKQGAIALGRQPGLGEERGTPGARGGPRPLARRLAIWLAVPEARFTSVNGCRIAEPGAAQVRLSRWAEPSTIRPMKQRIMLVDDHEVVRLGLKALIERRPDMEVIAEAASESEAITKAAAHRPDIVLMDIRLGGTSGIEACQKIMASMPETKIIMLTSYAEDDLLFAAIRAGAAGYVLKQAGGQEVIRAVEAVGQGHSLLDPALTERVFAEVRRAARAQESAAFAQLTEQERRVLILVAEGKTNREIAVSLHLGEGTVRNYVSNILGKLGVSNRAEAAAFAIKHHLKDTTE